MQLVGTKEETAEQVASTYPGPLILADGAQTDGRTRRFDPERLVRMPAGCRLDVDPHDLLQMSSPKRSPASPGTRGGVSGSSAPRTRWRWGPAPGSGAPWRRSAPNTSSKLRENLASRSRSWKRSGRPRSSGMNKRLRACWVTHVPFGVDGHPGHVDPPGVEFDEQHIQPAAAAAPCRR